MNSLMPPTMAELEVLVPTSAGWSEATFAGDDLGETCNFWKRPAFSPLLTFGGPTSIRANSASNSSCVGLRPK